MIGKCWFELISFTADHIDMLQKTVYPHTDYGLYMAEYDATPPQPRIYRVTIDGHDGTLDLSEWEGNRQIRYNDRTVTIKFVDMNGQKNANEFIQTMLGRRARIFFDDDSDYFFRGRCERAEAQTRKHVTTVEMTFICHPFRYSVKKLSDSIVVPPGEMVSNHEITIRGMNVFPSVFVTGEEPNKQLGYESYVRIKQSVPDTGKVFRIYKNGTLNMNSIILKSGINYIDVANSNSTNDLTIDISWRREVI